MESLAVYEDMLKDLYPNAHIGSAGSLAQGLLISEERLPG